MRRFKHKTDEQLQADMKRYERNLERCRHRPTRISIKKALQAHIDEFFTRALEEENK